MLIQQIEILRPTKTIKGRLLSPVGKLSSAKAKLLPSGTKAQDIGFQQSNSKDGGSAPSLAWWPLEPSKADLASKLLIYKFFTGMGTILFLKYIFDFPQFIYHHRPNFSQLSISKFLLPLFAALENLWDLFLNTNPLQGNS